MSTNQREINRRLRILKHARETGNVALTCLPPVPTKYSVRLATFSEGLLPLVKR